MTQSIAPRADRIRRLLEHLRNDSTDEFDDVVQYDPRGYTDPDVAARERELIFGRVPNIVAHGSEVPRPGDFITLRLPNNNVIIVRQQDGSVKALVNMCRHRGAMVEKQEKGQCRIFSCGYHRWSYDTDGTLRTVTRDNTFGDIDMKAQSLIELPCQEHRGFIWVIDDANSTEIDVAAWLGPEMDGILDGYELDNLVTYRAEGFDEPVNWKVMQDAFLDGYHIQYAHPNTAAKHIHTNVMVVEDFGRHARFIAPRKTIDKWLEEDPGDRDLSKNITESHYLGPNSTLLRQPDHCQLLTFRPHPTDPARCRMEMRLVVPKLEDSGLSEQKWNEVWDKNWKILLAVLHEEDFPLLRSAQQAVSSTNAATLMLGRNEVINQIFHRQLDQMLA
ncbi:aromatic ring-hydroxylating oxygenase subunit alpha [Mycolicibacterium thermoresistibile]